MQLEIVIYSGIYFLNKFLMGHIFKSSAQIFRIIFLKIFLLANMTTQFAKSYALYWILQLEILLTKSSDFLSVLVSYF